MYVRSRLDIPWHQLTRSFARSLYERPVKPSEIAKAWHPDAAIFFTERTAWDALLAELNLPKGSELLVSAVNIPDMYTLAEHHGLVVIPIAMDPATLTVNLEQLRAQISPKTRLILIASLLGTRHPMDAIFNITEPLGIPVVEDLAQAWSGDTFRGDERALASLFSFGPIKSSTSLGGCLARVSSAELRERMIARVQRYPRQGESVYGQIALKYMGMKALTGQSAYALFVKSCALLGKSHDAIINGQVLGLKGDDYWVALRRQPSHALLRTLKKQLPRHNPRLARRAQWGDRLAAMLPTSLTILGRDAKEHHWWLFGVVLRDPEALVSWLRQNGFDATSGASRLNAARAPEGHPEPDLIRWAMEHVTYLPAYPEISEPDLERLGALIRAFIHQHPGCTELGA